MIGDRPWVVTLPLAQAAEGRGLSKLWARRKIADAEVARTLRRITPDEADQRILALALEHHLVTRLTSLVAVDQTPSRPDGARLTRADIPLNLPAGWEFDKVFGGERAAGAGGTPRRRPAAAAGATRRLCEGGRSDVTQAAGAEILRGAVGAKRRDPAEDGDRRGTAAVVRARPLRRQRDPHRHLAPPAPSGGRLCAMTSFLPVPSGEIPGGDAVPPTPPRPLPCAHAAAPLRARRFSCSQRIEDLRPRIATIVDPARRRAYCSSAWRRSRLRSAAV